MKFINISQLPPVNLPTTSSIAARPRLAENQLDSHDCRHSLTTTVQKNLAEVWLFGYLLPKCCVSESISGYTCICSISTHNKTMAMYVGNCPRCKTKKITFDVLSCCITGYKGYTTVFETFCRCRHCKHSTIIEFDNPVGEASLNDIISDNDITITINDHVSNSRFINISDVGSVPTPDNLPEEIANAFTEGARAHAIQCWNAAGCMFRACVDLTFNHIVESKEKGDPDGLKKLGLKRRLEKLFEKSYLDEGLSDLASCIREDGNDAAHDVSLKMEESEDLQDFTERLVSIVFSEPAKLRLATERRNKRRCAS